MTLKEDFQRAIAASQQGKSSGGKIVRTISLQTIDPNDMSDEEKEFIRASLEGKSIRYQYSHRKDEAVFSSGKIEKCKWFEDNFLEFYFIDNYSPDFPDQRIDIELSAKEVITLLTHKELRIPKRLFKLI